MPARDAATSDKDAVDDCQASEQLVDLVSPTQAAADPLVDGKVRRVLAEEADPSRRRRKVAGDRVEQSRLSGAVRTEDRPPLAGLNPKVDVGEGDKGAELPADALELQALLDERRSAKLPSTMAGVFSKSIG